MVMATEEVMNKAQAAPEPGDLKELGTSDVGAVRLKSLESAGWVYIWNTKTGDRSICNRNMLKKQLEKRHPDGTLAFTTTEPAIKPFRGVLKCMLHSEGPDREHFNQIGLPVCNKSNLTSPYQVERHMQKRHKTEWAIIKSEKEKREKEEDRALQRAVVAGLQKQKETAPIATDMEYEELVALGKSLGITSKLKKGALIAAIKEAQDANPDRELTN